MEIRSKRAIETGCPARRDFRSVIFDAHADPCMLPYDRAAWRECACMLLSPVLGLRQSFPVEDLNGISCSKWNINRDEVRRADIVEVFSFDSQDGQASAGSLVVGQWLHRS